MHRNEVDGLALAIERQTGRRWPVLSNLALALSGRAFWSDGDVGARIGALALCCGDVERGVLAVLAVGLGLDGYDLPELAGELAQLETGARVPVLGVCYG